MPEEDAPFEGWAILELMGHRQLAGYVRDVPMFGSAVIRLDVPDAGEATAEPGAATDHNATLLGTPVFPEMSATQFYAPSALYCLTPTTEGIARAVAARAKPTPVHLLELERPAALHVQEVSADERLARLATDDRFTIEHVRLGEAEEYGWEIEASWPGDDGICTVLNRSLAEAVDELEDRLGEHFPDLLGRGDIPF